MPGPVKITIQNKVYITPILNGEMDDINNQINSKKDEIKSLNDHLAGAIQELNNLQKSFMALYIQQTGQFHPPVQLLAHQLQL